MRVLELTLGVAVAASMTAAIYLKRRGEGGAHQGVERKITIGRDTAELYAAWLSLLPQTMEPFAAVRISDTHVNWTLRSPGAKSYDTVLEHSPAGERLRWTKFDASRPQFSGAVEFAAAPAGRGTEVTLRFATALPRTMLGTVVSSSLRRFKSLIETGELASLERNPTGRRGARSKLVQS